MARVKVDDLDGFSLSEIEVLFANPRNLEDRLAPKGTRVAEHLSNYDLDMARFIYQCKLDNNRAQQAVLLQLLEGTHIFDYIPDYERDEKGEPLKFANMSELMDFAAEEIFTGTTGRLIERVDREWIEFQKKRIKERQSSGQPTKPILPEVRKYRDKEGHPWRNAGKNVPVDLRYRLFSRDTIRNPLLILEKAKTVGSLLDKISFEVVRAEKMGNDPFERQWSDRYGIGIVTPYANEPPFKPPSGRMDHNPQARLINFANIDERVQVGDSRNYYQEEGPLNITRIYLRPATRAMDEMGMLPYQELVPGREWVSLLLTDARNFASYLFGPEAHIRAKIKGHKGTHSKDMDLSRTEKKRMKKYRSSVEPLLTA